MNGADLVRVLPPRLVIALASARGRAGGVGYRRAASWIAAKRDCGSGHQEPAVVAWQTELVCATRGVSHLSPNPEPSTQYMRIAAALLSVATGCGRDTLLAVDDVGGQDGRLFYEFGQFAPELVLDWHVIETPALVSALREAELDADEFNDSRIRWVSRSERKADVVIAAGVLQLLDDPLEKLRSLLADGPVVLDKVPVVKGGGTRSGRSSTAVIAWDGVPGVALRGRRLDRDRALLVGLRVD